MEWTENQVTSYCELHRLSEDDEIHNVNDEQLEEGANLIRPALVSHLRWTYHPVYPGDKGTLTVGAQDPVPVRKA